MELFLDVADESQVRQVITGEKLQSLITKILGVLDDSSYCRPSYLRPDISEKKVESKRFSKKQLDVLSIEARFRRAKLAENFIQKGNEYFTENNYFRTSFSGTNIEQNLCMEYLDLISSFPETIRRNYPNNDKLKD